MEYKSFTTTPSSSHIFSKKIVHSARDCWDSKAAISICTFRLLVLRPFPRSPAASASFFTSLLHLSVFSYTTRFELCLPCTIPSNVLWLLKQACRRQAPCQTADMFCPSEFSQQYDTVIGKELLKFPPFTSTSDPRSVA